MERIWPSHVWPSRPVFARCKGSITRQGCPFSKTSIITAAIMAAYAASGPVAACEQWSVAGPFKIYQSNNIFVGGEFVQEGARISGEATFVGRDKASKGEGALSGVIEGDVIRFRVAWSGDWLECGLTCTEHFYGGIGIYEGAITENGDIQGKNWDYAHPDDKVDWYLTEPAKCLAQPASPPQSDKPVTGLGKKRPSGPPPNPDAANPGGVSASRGSSAATRDIGSIAGVAPQAAAVTPEMMMGMFDTTFGRMVLGRDGGTYATNDGVITIGKIEDNVMRGHWQESKGRRCADGRIWGSFRFVFTEEGFTGAYGYCEGEPNYGQWNGTRL